MRRRQKKLASSIKTLAKLVLQSTPTRQTMMSNRARTNQSPPNTVERLLQVVVTSVMPLLFLLLIKATSTKEIILPRVGLLKDAWVALGPFSLGNDKCTLLVDFLRCKSRLVADATMPTLATTTTTVLRIDTTTDPTISDLVGNTSNTVRQATTKEVPTVLPCFHRISNISSSLVAATILLLVKARLLRGAFLRLFHTDARLTLALVVCLRNTTIGVVTL
jgi:hypothetical protein